MSKSITIHAYRQICKDGSFDINNSREFLSDDRLYDVFIRTEVGNNSQCGVVRGRDLSYFIRSVPEGESAFVQVAPLGAFKKAIQLMAIGGN